MQKQLQTMPLSPTSDRSSSRDYQETISKVLCLVVLAMGVFNAITTALIMIRTHSPIIYWDQWSIVDNLMKSGGHPTLGQLWAQHNEHRIPVGRLACYADLLLFGGRNLSLLIGIYVVQLSHLLVFLWMIRRSRSFTFTIGWTALGIVLFCMFCPIQIENFAWGFEITFVVAGFAASLAFASAIWYSEVANQADWRFAILPLLLCIVTAFVSECSLSNGTIVWPVLSLLAFRLRFPRRVQWLLGIVGTSAIAAYMRGYQSPPHHSSPFTSIQHPLKVGKYVVTYFASTWDPNLPSTGLWPSVSETLTILALVLALLGAFRVFIRRAQASRLEIFLYADVMFVLISANITALGRVTLGIGQAASSRYQTVALVFWTCFVILLLTWCTQSVSRLPWVIQIQAGVLVLMMANASRFGSYERFAEGRQAALAKGYAALVTNSSDQESLKLLFPAPQLLPAWYHYLRAHNLGPDPRDYGGSFQDAPSAVQLAVTPGSSVARVSGYQVVPPSRCSGFLDVAKPIPGQPGSFTVVGWAWDVKAENRPFKVVLATSDGTIAGGASLGAPRPDVHEAIPQIKDANTGWNGAVQLPSGAVIHAFAVLADKKSVCPLMNEFHAP